jgi:ammonium transporter Rh
MAIKFFHLALVFQVVLLILFGVFVRYPDSITDARRLECASYTSQQECVQHDCEFVIGSTTCLARDSLPATYALFQDVHIMIFVGFGFLMTFISSYGFSGVGYNFLLASAAIQWSILTNGFWHNIFASGDHGDGINSVLLTLDTLITSDFAAGAVLISFGAIIGKSTPTQLLAMVIIELIFYSLNESICVLKYDAVDMGGSMYVHAFGALFGMAVSRVLGNKHRESKTKYQDHESNKSSSVSDTRAMIGTLFLFAFWPSFNGALATGASQYRVVINTTIALTFSCLTSFSFDKLLRPSHKLDMVTIQNATLAGGVAVGSSADLVIQPWGAAIIGSIAGIISVVGYIWITPYLDRRWNLHDTAGVNNLHGMPGIIGGIGGIISAATASANVYGESIAIIYPARGLGRTAGEQGLYQFAALGTTIGIAILGGAITGFILNNFPAVSRPFNDDEDWHVPTTGQAGNRDDSIESTYKCADCDRQAPQGSKQGEFSFSLV